MGEPMDKVDEVGASAEGAADARDARVGDARAREVIPYGPPLPWHRRRVWVKVAVALVVLAGGIYGIRFGMRVASGWLRNRAIDREQQAMLSFTQPKTMVVYEEDPAKGRELLAGGKGYRAWEWGPEKEKMAWGTPVMFARRPGFPEGVMIDYLGEAGLFLHGRRSPGGNERIVSLGDPSIFCFCRHSRQICFVFSVGRPGGGAGKLPVFDSFGPPVLPLTGEERLRLFAGQADPMDLSHWTIGYELNGQAGMIDGYLQDNDGISLQVRDGPLLGRIRKPSISAPVPKCPLEHN